jgi:hypothetical protein
MSKLTIATTERFGNLDCNFYENSGEYLITRQQIGEALEYADPKKSIDKIHHTHKKRIDKFSITIVSGVGGKNPTIVSGVGEEKPTIVSGVGEEKKVKRKMTFYTRRGVMEICRWSRQPKADAFMDFCWDVMERLMKGDTPVSQPDARLDILTEEVHKLTQRVETFIEGEKTNELQLCSSGGEPIVPGKAARRRWMQTLNEKLDLLENKFNATRNQILHMLYSFIEKRYNVLLDEERIKCVERYGLNDCATIEAIFYNEEYRLFIERNIDFNIAPENRGW